MRIKSCRICNTSPLAFVGSLGNISISDFTKNPKKGISFPLDLVYCDSCNLLQLGSTPSRRIMYEGTYWYESHLNPTIVSDLKSIVKDALLYSPPKKGDVWIDIGANDGTLLSLVPSLFYKIGIDPASNLIKKLKNNTDKTIEGYFENASLMKKASVITAIAMFYDLPDPNKFTQKLKSALLDDGIAIIQLMTLSPMIENNDIGNICHEHIEYYSYKSLAALFEKHGLEIFNVKTNDMNGGSYRLFIRHKKNGSINFPEKQYNILELRKFFKRVEKNKKNFLDFLKTCKKAGKTVAAYGASTKGNTIMQYYNLNVKDIPSVVDINPKKTGRYLIHSKIPITNTVPSCDYLWVLPYGFLPYFIEKEREFKKNGGKFVLSTPKFTII